MTFDEFVALASSEARWEGVTKLPWNEAAFSARMLREHLSQLHDGASRRLSTIERHVSWIHNVVLKGRPQSVLDLGCGPGFYTQRLAALGHDVLGLDIAPAAIDYARSHARAEAQRLRYELADFTVAPLAGPFDFAMMIHGEFNTLSREQASRLLGRIARTLARTGSLLLEVHRIDVVEAMGNRGRRWFAVQSGLFGDVPHVRLDESRWDAQQAQAVNLNWVIDGETRTVTRFGTVTQGYSHDEYGRLLRESGFSRLDCYPALTGESSDAQYTVLVASI